MCIYIYIYIYTHMCTYLHTYIYIYTIRIMMIMIIDKYPADASGSACPSVGSKPRGPDPNDKPLTRKDKSTCRGLHSKLAALCSY